MIFITNTWLHISINSTKKASTARLPKLTGIELKALRQLTIYFRSDTSANLSDYLRTQISNVAPLLVSEDDALSDKVRQNSSIEVPIIDSIEYDDPMLHNSHLPDLTTVWIDLESHQEKDKSKNASGHLYDPTLKINRKCGPYTQENLNRIQVIELSETEEVCKKLIKSALKIFENLNTIQVDDAALSGYYEDDQRSDHEDQDKVNIFKWHDLKDWLKFLNNLENGRTFKLVIHEYLPMKFFIQRKKEYPNVLLVADNRGYDFQHSDNKFTIKEVKEVISYFV